MVELRMDPSNSRRPKQRQPFGYATELNERYGGREWRIAAIGSNRLLPLPL